MLRKIIKYKVFYDRGGHYWTYVRTVFLIAVAYKIFEDSVIGLWFYEHRVLVIPITVIGYVIVRVILGWVDFKKKIREYEIAEYNKTDPNIRKIHRDLETIIDKLNDNSAGSEPTREGR